MAFSDQLQELDGVARSDRTETDVQAKYKACKRSSAFKDFEESMLENLREKLNPIFNMEVESLTEAIDKVAAFAVSFDPCVFFEKFSDFVDKNENEDCDGLVKWTRKFIETSNPYCKINEV